MVGGVTYRSVEPDGVRVFVNGETNKEMLIEADNVVICAGQVPERSLADQLVALGRNHHVIGGAEEAEELDAKRAVDQGTRLAARL